MRPTGNLSDGDVSYILEQEGPEFALFPDPFITVPATPLVPAMHTLSHHFQGFETQQVHAGQRVDSATNARAVPIYASTSFVFNNAAHAEEIFGLKTNGYTYSRMSNPTVEVFENRMATLEGGRGAVAAATGQSAQVMAIMTLASSGDNIVISAQMHSMALGLESALEGLGVKVKLVSTDDPADFAASIDLRTKAIFVESISRSNFTISATREFAEVAHKAGIPLIVDNTLGIAGFLVRPIDHGADIVVESITKWIDGHGFAHGGIVIDSGNFDWKRSNNYPGLTKPSTGHHTFVYADNFEPTAFATKLRADILRDLGPTLEPFSAFFMLQGLETLSLRAEKQCQNALALARWLEKHIKVASVSYLGLETHAFHALAKSYLKEGHYGAALVFVVKGGFTAADTVMCNLSLATYLDAFGDTKTLVFRQPDNGSAGRDTKVIRVHAGIEAIEDIIADFAIALACLN